MAPNNCVNGNYYDISKFFFLMIREIRKDHFDDIDSIIKRYRELTKDDSLPDNFAEQIKDSITENKACVYGEYSEDGFLKGMALFGKASVRINFAYAAGDVEIEKRLVSALFERFKNDYPHITTGGPWISEELSKHFVEIGFSKYDRMHMTLPRSDIEALAEPELSEGMSFEPYTPEIREKISQLVFEGNDGHVDQNVFPDFFGSLEGSTRLLESIEASRFGDYRESSSWILFSNDTPAGACFMTVRDGDTGYIPDIVIKKEFRGRGLGKSLLVQSMKRLAESEPALSKVNLDVTLKNNARYLYASLGFEKVHENSIYSWRKAQ